jgi:ribosome-associated protein
MSRAYPFPDEPDDPDDDGRPSKSELKRQMHELQQLGQALTELPASRVDALDLPESLRDGLAEFHRTRSFEGKRRQLQFIGKLMRQVDPDPIRESIAAAKLGSAKDTLALHHAERWREELLAGDDALTRWSHAHPQTDLQQLRSLVRAARKDALAEQVDQRHGRPYRDLFQLIKTALAEAAADPAEADAAGEPGDD